MNNLQRRGSEWVQLCRREGFLVWPGLYFSSLDEGTITISRGVEVAFEKNPELVWKTGRELLGMVPRKWDKIDGKVLLEKITIAVAEVDREFLQGVAGVATSNRERVKRRLRVDQSFNLKVEDEHEEDSQIRAINEQIDNLEKRLEQRKEELRREKEGLRSSFGYVVEEWEL